MIALISIISVFSISLYVVLLIYLRIGWAKATVRHVPGPSFKTRVTVLIAARNEEANIGKTIQDLLEQDYPKHLVEIIIVDDHSTDSTADIIRSYEPQGVKLLQLKLGEVLNSYKKKAIAEAIKLSTGDFLMATDADCRMGKSWISTVVGFYEQNNLVMISSPVTYFQEQSVFERMQTLDFSSLIGMGGSFITLGFAATCNGANFAYRKDVFYEVGGFSGIDELASGDDELLLHKVAQKYPGRIGFLKHREAIVYTHAKPNLKEFMNQRRRWASKSTKYKDKRMVAFALSVWLCNFMLFFTAVLGIFNLYFLKLFFITIGAKYIIDMVYMTPIMNFLKRRQLLWYVSFTLPANIIYFIIIGFLGKNKKYAWKGRMVK
ncbi:glycosyltransferase family 2 protein [Mucilaginibacter celer]|uniref:Glycosyltransferase n=1 Tax=Mucilaginibacter celer TaxID=2305508 RepID=A0A494VRK0_9SPHI|nr:glycosyltransferase [Mucilaginibacter celer]AYL98237.1 glycosyltransferase [Mucilaginibacter celer]